MENLKNKIEKRIDLKELAPCESGYKFAQSKASLIEAWETCERGDWMLWFTCKLGCPVELLTLAKGKCAETVIHLMRDDRSRNAVKVAIDFGNGVATREELDAASDAASNAAYADAASNAAYVARAAADSAAYADAAYAAHAAAEAAFDDAAYYTDTADEDEDAADADAARKENQLMTANICREVLTDFIKTKI